MEDPVLNKNLEELKELQTRWNQFHDFVLMAMQNKQAIGAQAELKFLELKSRIAMLHDSFMAAVKHDAKTAQNVLQIVSDCILLQKLTKSSEAERQKFEFDWNECFMMLTDTVSSMEEEKKRLAGINERAWKAAKARELWKARFHNFLHSNQLKWTGILAAIGVVLYVIPAFFWPYTNFYTDPQIKQYTAKPYKLFVAYLYRPIFKSYEYIDLDEVILNEKADAPGPEKGEVNKDKFLALLPAIGIAPGDLAEAKKLVNDAAVRGKTYMADGSPLQVIQVLFKTTPDRERFVKMQKDHIATLNGPQRDAVMNMTWETHRANLLVIGYGQSGHRFGYVCRRFGFKEGKTNNDLD